MTTDHGHDEAHEHGGTIPLYLAVFVALCIFTAVSFAVNYAVGHGQLAAFTGFAIILGVAICKALLVCAYFMHVKWDWSKLYFLMVPVFVLAPMLVMALLPDIVLYWKNFYKG